MRASPLRRPLAVTRRGFLRLAAASTVGWSGPAPTLGAGPEAAGEEPYFQTRGVVVVVRDLETLDWPALAKRCGLTTIGTHITPREIAAFVQTEKGQRFLRDCRRHGIQVEHELHAMHDLLPRERFDTDPTLFPMDEKGNRVRGYNLCVHSKAALEIVAENAARYTRLLPSTTGRYFYWPDDAQPMCRCPNCRGLSDSDQALILNNRLLAAIRQVDARATLAHLAYARTLPPPSRVKPVKGVFLEFAPIERVYDRPFADRQEKGRQGRTHGELLDFLDANLAVFGSAAAQTLEYWLDASRFSGWRRDRVVKIPWNRAVYLQDVDLYAKRGIRHVTNFAAWVDGDYVKRFGTPPVDEYADGLLRWTLADGKPRRRH
jgi:hypothetical protein